MVRRSTARVMASAILLIVTALSLLFSATRAPDLAFVFARAGDAALRVEQKEVKVDRVLAPSFELTKTSTPRSSDRDPEASLRFAVVAPTDVSCFACALEDPGRLRSDPPPDSRRARARLMVFLN